MKQTIYISDLDGTLLNGQKEITPNTSKLLNELIAEGGHFSVATARTPATVENILSAVAVKEPIVVMNGAALYDLSKHEYVAVEYLPTAASKEIMKRLGEQIKQGFIYTIQSHRLTVFYDELKGKGRINFFEERKNLKYKQFIKAEVKELEPIAYFVFIDTKTSIEVIREKISGIEGIASVMYKDIYDEEAYLLEVYSEQATKSKGINKLKSLRGFEKVICFGDQLNDLSMFGMADEAYAVGNAVEELKQVATEVIESNEMDSVAKFIKRHYAAQTKLK